MSSTRTCFIRKTVYTVMVRYVLHTSV